MRNCLCFFGKIYRKRSFTFWDDEERRTAVEAEKNA